MFDPDLYIQQFNLVAHPEGGYYRETYRSDLLLGEFPSKSDLDHKRVASTAIYFLLKAGEFSAFHRIASDEVWHFYDGDALLIHTLTHEGHQSFLLGRNLSEGELPQFVVKAGVWFACSVPLMNRGALVGCTVSPGFEFEDFELAKRENLLTQYPEYHEVILQLTRA